MTPTYRVTVKDVDGKILHDQCFQSRPALDAEQVAQDHASKLRQYVYPESEFVITITAEHLK